MVLFEKQSVENLEAQFHQLVLQTSTDAYKQKIEVKTFRYLPESNFSAGVVAFVQNLYADEIAAEAIELNRLTGTKSSEQSEEGSFCEEISFELFEKKVSAYFAYVANDQFVDERWGSKEHIERLSTFWRILTAKFELPPSRCIEYYPGENSYFFISLPWACSAILLREEEKQGLFVRLDGWF